MVDHKTLLFTLVVETTEAAFMCCQNDQEKYFLTENSCVHKNGKQLQHVSTLLLHFGCITDHDIFCTDYQFVAGTTPPNYR